MTSREWIQSWSEKVAEGIVQRSQEEEGKVAVGMGCRRKRTWCMARRLGLGFREQML